LGRSVRIFFEGMPQHIVIEALDDLEICRDTIDSDFFYERLLVLTKKYGVDMHAYSLCKGFFTFVATPKTRESLPKFMQSFGKSYVTFYNKRHQRTGTIWNGRYRSSLLEKSSYLLDTMRYIESHAESVLSSFGRNSQNKKDSLVVLPDFYKDFGVTDTQRADAYNQSRILKSKRDFLVRCLFKQTITGSKYFIENLEQQSGETYSRKKRGRPKKINKKKQGKTMYKNLVLLDKEEHKNLKINPIQNLFFAKNLNFIPTLAQEISHISTAFPVVFTGDEKPSLVTLVGLGVDNLAINQEGKWITSYVPAMLRKYPFHLAATQENLDNKVILIDEDSELFSTTTGTALFNENGEAGESLENAKKFLIGFEQQAVSTAAIIATIVKADILEDREIAVGEGEDKKILVNGFKIIDTEKLYALSDDILADWARKGILRFIDEHVKSLAHIENLFKLANARQ